MKFLIKLNRLSAWVLLFIIIFYVATGFGITRGIISPSFATRWHIGILSYFLLISFVYHSAFGAYLAFKRWGIWNRFGKILLVSFFLIFVLFFVYVDVFYSKDKSSIKTPSTYATTQTIIPKTTLTSSSSTESQESSATKTFTSEELAKYDGQDGQSAYAAIDGIVYDLSSVFKNGDHFGYTAGQDLSADFHSQHDLSLLSGFPIVGRLQ